jgi:UDP-glucuronate decarboxylase
MDEIKKEKLEMNSYQEDIQTALHTFPLPVEQLSGKRILVLGATGLIGGCLVGLLLSCGAEDCHVYAAGRNKQRADRRFAAFSQSPSYHFLRFDVTEPLECDIPFDYIVDAAGGASPQLYTSDPVGVMKSNIWGVDHLLSYGVNHGLQKFVYVSSGEVYGEGDGHPFVETDSGYINPLTVRACYPSAKRATETLCVCYSCQYGIDVSIARPCHVYGPYFTESDNRVYAQFVRNVLRGEDIVLKSKGEAYRSWIYVVDCAMALLHILLLGENGAAYNIANEESNVSIRTLAELTAELSGRQVVFEIPDDATCGNTTPITKAVFSTSRLESLGWRPLTPLREGLAHTLDSLR